MAPSHVIKCHVASPQLAVPASLGVERSAGGSAPLLRLARLAQFTEVRSCQHTGTFAERGTDGSNINGVYATSGTWGEVKGSHGDHANAEHEPAIHFLSDPSEEEQALLAHMVDFSPSCSGSK